MLRSSYHRNCKLYVCDKYGLFKWLIDATERDHSIQFASAPLIASTAMILKHVTIIIKNFKINKCNILNANKYIPNELTHMGM